MDSANKYGILPEVVQVLTDLKLIVREHTYPPTEDGSWMVGQNENWFLFVPFVKLVQQFLSCLVYILVPVQFVESVNLFLCSLSGLILAFFPRGGEPLEWSLPPTTP